MVSIDPPAPSRARLLAAGAAEFAARGFDGAKVDRIAARARVNKAMLYYHFTNKAALYREILRDLFASAATAVTAVREGGGPPEDQLRAFVRAVADNAVSKPHFPGIWLREIAEGGRRLDGPIVIEMKRVLQTLAAILEDGRRSGRFAPVHPLVIQMGIVAPLLFFGATAAVRDRVRHMVPPALAPDIPREAVIQYVQAATLAALAAPPEHPAREADRPTPRRHRV